MMTWTFPPLLHPLLWACMALAGMIFSKAARAMIIEIHFLDTIIMRMVPMVGVVSTAVQAMTQSMVVLVMIILIQAAAMTSSSVGMAVIS